MPDGIGFVARVIIVLADENAQFSLSELLFGFYPRLRAAVSDTPRRVSEGTLLDADDPAHFGEASLRMGAGGCISNHKASFLLGQHLQTVRRLSKAATRRYKAYMSRISMPLQDLKSLAVALIGKCSPRPAICKASPLRGAGLFPWEKSEVAAAEMNTQTGGHSSSLMKSSLPPVMDIAHHFRICDMDFH